VESVRGHDSGSPAAPAAPQPVYSGRAAAPPGLRRLQATAGNTAVALMVQRTLSVQRAPVTNDAEFTAAVGRGDWTPAEAYLVGLPLAAVE